MSNPSDFLPMLIQYGNIVHEHLLKHLTDDQITGYLNYFHTPTTKYGEALQLVSEEHGHPESVFYALESLARINALCNAAESPSDTPISPDQAFIAAFCALRSGMIIGAVVDDKGKDAILTLAKHGQKFASNGGRGPDKFTDFLVSLFLNFHAKEGRYPKNKEVLRLVESEQGQGFIHSVDDEVIEWGKSGQTKIVTMLNRLADIRKKYQKNKSR